MSTCAGAPAPHYPCRHGERCDWSVGFAAPSPLEQLAGAVTVDAEPVDANVALARRLGLDE